jgi:putative phosphoribosyl transferase
MTQIFQDRRDAGKELAKHLSTYEGKGYTVLALPRGGVPVAYEVASRLKCLLDVFVVRKIGVPSQPELAMGAVASNGVRILNHNVIYSLHVPSALIDSVTQRELMEIERREILYRSRIHALDLSKVILVDDGLATGATMKAAIKALRQLNCMSLIVGVPVGAPEICALLEKSVDRLVCVLTPERLYSVGEWYHDFSQTSDDEVRDLLKLSGKNFDEVA